MHTPDLSLASSYIPACLCFIKSIFVFILFLFSPLRGWIGICSLLVTDRILWNRLNPIIDVNAVNFALAGGLAITRARENGVDSLFRWAVIAPWGLLCGLQVLGATRLHRSVEIIFAACAVSILSCMHQDIDPPEILALRAFVFVVSNIALAYLGIMLCDDYSDSYIHISRTLVLLLGDWKASVGWAAMYLLCVGYQIRAKAYVSPEEYLHPSTPPPVQHYAESNCDIVMPSKLQAISTVSSSGSMADETGLLREALARKGFHARESSSNV